MTDISDLKDRIILSAWIGRYVLLESNGPGEWKAICPFHDEKTKSFTVSDDKGFFHCFGCGVHGDFFDFMALLEGNSIKETKEILQGEINLLKNTISSPRPNKGISDRMLPMLPGREPAEAVFNHSQFGKPEQIWTYRTYNGEPMMFNCRFEGKNFRPLSLWYDQDSDKEEWLWRSLPSPRPLYGLDRLHKHPHALVVVCEGEKAADAVQEVVRGCVGITWPNGASSVPKALWGALKGREVMLWPDNDEPGRNAMNQVRAIVGRMANVGPDIEAPKGADKGWDAADSLMAGLIFHRGIAT